MEHCLEGVRNELGTPYVDNLIIYLATFEDHLNHLQQVFERLRKLGIKVKASKFQLFKKEVLCPSRLVSSEYYTADPKNVTAVQQLCQELSHHLNSSQSYEIH